MSRQRTRSWFASRRPPVAQGLGVAVLVGVILGAAAAPAEASWGLPYLSPPQLVGPTPPDQSWLMDVPEKPGAHSRGKVAVFIFKGDDFYQPVRAAMVRVLRGKGLNVTASLRPVDSAAQFREMSYTLNLAAYVEGELIGEGAHQRAVIRVRSGVTGRPIAAAKFSGSTPEIAGAIGHTLWTRVGGAMMRACSSVSRPRHREREPLRIEAGTDQENTPLASHEGI